VAETKKPIHFTALDGLRGLMALGVVIAHVKLAWFPGAHIMMDIFFVISAFLITFTLRKSIAKGRSIQLITFWKRRLLRLYPALITVVVVYVCVAFFLHDNMAPLLKDALTTLLYVSNFTKLEGYVYPHFFGHTWSLSIEEQFYLLWPIMLVLMLKFNMLWRIRIPIFLAMIVASILWRLHLVDAGVPWSRLYYGSETRIDAFVVGGLLAFYWDDLIALSNRSRVFLSLLRASALALLVAVIVWDPKIVYYFKWQQPVVLFLSCLVIVLLTRDDTAYLQRFFSHKIPAALGVRCYGIYLWHWPLIWLLIVHTDLEAPAIFAITMPVTLALSWLMYKYIELPILKRRPVITPAASP
jgi:peptidoglycan/LPS O-acetylase OafA/YrhL